MKCPSTISLPGGCNWTGPTASLENHLPLCDMKIVECNFKGRGCILRSYQRELAQHLQICSYRIEKCLPVVWRFPIVINQAMMSFVWANWCHARTIVGFRLKGRFLVRFVLLLMRTTFSRQSSFALYIKKFSFSNHFHSYLFRCKMLSHQLGFCVYKGRTTLSPLCCGL